MVQRMYMTTRRRFDMRFGKRPSDVDAAHLLDAVFEAGEENMSRFTKDVLAALYVLWKERGGELPLTGDRLLAFLRANGTTQSMFITSSNQPSEIIPTQPARTNKAAPTEPGVTVSADKMSAKEVANNFLKSMQGFLD